ncbi:flagellar basal body rod protein FlgB [Paenisporosarcina quisquiliarum]|uniref:Flagellar basal body rod protein FlgB n=1 Tax=Paenisporosarcina quisquiliarum TaxID=365346 RepID=A0A9X3LH58_9BACL|nr:flagellar basal body rod protein FlgB [Paenisporosarcina quisquiliarum]MCZ8536916.1 flagellar basal body rod protein FlgB [Paenisporosarcina quisquiliarum]
MKLFPQSFQSLESALSNATLKQRIHSANIANVDTPNYKSKQVSFQSTLNDAMNNQGMSSYKTNAKHIAFSSESSNFNPTIKENKSTQFNPNGNNVDMDYEMAELAKNQLWYNAVTERVNGKFNSLRTVINDGR